MTPAQRPAVTAVIATHDRPSLLADAVSSVLASLERGDRLVVVESGDSGAARLSPASNLVVMTGAPVAKTAKLNRVAADSPTDVLVLTDDDCVVERGWVSGLARPFSDPAVAATFGPVTGLSRLPGTEDPVVLPSGAAPTELWAFAHGASMGVRRSALFDVGGFDERLGPGSPVAAGEEGDLVLRLRERGWACAVADAPLVRNRGWRRGDEGRHNVLAYHRGAGAYLGAGLRRSPRGTAKQLLLRARFETEVAIDRRSFRTVGAFAGGLATGVRMRPQRWL